MRVRSISSAIAPCLVLCTALASARAAREEKPWIEVRSPRFLVVSNAGESWARRLALKFEQIRAAFQAVFPNMPSDSGEPIIIVAVRTEKELQELLPEYWKGKGPRPAGVFQQGIDKHFIVVRVDISEDDPYQIVYHEYFHFLARPGAWVRMPLWLSEGLAGFFENTEIRGKRVTTGKPDWSQLRYLQYEGMLPLQEVLEMETNPHDSDPEKVWVFYAQSWALVHYIMVGDKTGGLKKAVGDYLNLLATGVDHEQAFPQTLGDMKKLEKAVKDYVGRARFIQLRLEVPAGIEDEDFAARALTPAESAAILGSFFVRGQRPEDGRPLLEEALALEPDLAVAHEGMGYLHWRQDRPEEAARWFSQAARLDPQNWAALYFSALLDMTNADDGKVYEQSAASLERSIELNPQFAPAHAQLALLYASRRENLAKAWGPARRSLELDSTQTWYWVNAGQILLRMNRPDEARKAVERGLEAAQSPEDREMAVAFMKEVQEAEQYGGPPPSDPPAGIDTTRTDDAASEKEPQLPQGFEAAYREIRGRLISLACLPGAGPVFVVAAEGVRHELRFESAVPVTVREGGKLVEREFHCGPQDRDVVARYLPDGGSGNDLKGKLLSLELLSKE